MSIPFCAVIGGGMGLATGATVGGAAGTVGGASGYYAWVRRAAIRAWSACMAEKARQSANELQEQAWQSANDLRQSANELREKGRQSASDVRARVNVRFNPSTKSR